MSRRRGLGTLLRLRELRERQALVAEAQAAAAARQAEVERRRREQAYVGRAGLAAGGPELVLAGQLRELALHEQVEAATERLDGASAELDEARRRRAAAATERRRLELLLERLEARAVDEARRRTQAEADEQAVLGRRRP